MWQTPVECDCINTNEGTGASIPVVLPSGTGCHKKCCSALQWAQNYPLTTCLLRSAFSSVAQPTCLCPVAALLPEVRPTQHQPAVELLPFAWSIAEMRSSLCFNISYFGYSRSSFSIQNGCCFPKLPVILCVHIFRGWGEVIWLLCDKQDSVSKIAVLACYLLTGNVPPNAKSSDAAYAPQELVALSAAPSYCLLQILLINSVSWAFL